MTPSYKDPTVLESHWLLLDGALGRTKACIGRRVGRAGGIKITQNGRTGIWAARVP